MRTIGLDTETARFLDRRTIRSRAGDPINISPYIVPDLVLASIAEGTESKILTPAGLTLFLEKALRDPEVHLVLHNLVFDFEVVCKASLQLRQPFEEAAIAGRLHDTMILDLLLGLAQGRFDKPKYHPESKTWAPEEPLNRSLDKLAWEYCGIQLNKDPAIRLHYGDYLGRPLADLPPEFVEYAKQDAVATLRVFQEQERRLAALGAQHHLSEALQIRAAIALRGLEQVGVAVDQPLAGKLEAAFLEEQRPLETALVAAGLGRWEAAEPGPKEKFTKAEGAPRPLEWTLRSDGRVERWRLFKMHDVQTITRPKFCLNTKVIQERLGTLEDEGAPVRDDGTLSLDADYWSSAIPPGHPELRVWLSHEKVKKILSTYLSVYSQTTEIFPKWIVLGPRSGRMAAAKPNLQNIPKRKNGIRALFIPHEGFLYIRADYSAQEMFTLCEVMLGMGIIGPLYRALTSGIDIHRYGASLVLGKPIADVTPAERQNQKVLHFGVPGGLGPKKLTAYAYSNYGVEWTVDEARDRRHRFLMTFTDIQDYLCKLKMSQDDALLRATQMDRAGWAKAMGAKTWNVIREMTLHPSSQIQAAGLMAERQCCVVLPSGRQRGFCRFTEAANSYFQGLAADVTKTAVWGAYRAGLRMVLVVHDEIVIESLPEEVDQDAIMLEKAMLDAFKSCCPRVGAYVKVEVEKGLTCWGKATNLEGKPLTL